jgi:hypothetical protein
LTQINVRSVRRIDVRRPAGYQQEVTPMREFGLGRETVPRGNRVLPKSIMAMKILSPMIKRWPLPNAFFMIGLLP